MIPAVEIIIACLLAIYYRKYGSSRKLLPWFLGLSVAFPFFWFIREDSIWLLPFTVVALGISFVQILLGQDFSFKEVEKLKTTLSSLETGMAETFIVFTSYSWLFHRLSVDRI